MEVIVERKDTVIVSQRNVDMVMAYSNGHSMAAIAKKQKLSKRTIESVFNKLRAEFGCKNLPHLVATFIRKGLIK